jgi:mono/diheme cytochrome c family protein
MVAGWTMETSVPVMNIDRLKTISMLIGGAMCVLAGPSALAASKAQIQAKIQAKIQAGHALAKARCSHCHSVEPQGNSPLAAAPPFRTLSTRYPLDSLQEALAEGIDVGHQGMPSTPWKPADINRFIAYLKTINAKPNSPAKTHQH